MPRQPSAVPTRRPGAAPRGVGVGPGRSRRAPLRRVAGVVGTYAVLAAGALITLAPYLLSLLTSLKSPRQFAREDPLALPSPPSFDNYAALFGGRYDFVPPLAITVQVVVVVLVGQLVCSVLAAYAFARVRFPGRELLFWSYLATLMVPQIVTLVPLYTMLSTVGLRDTFWGIVLPLSSGRRTRSSCCGSTSAAFPRTSSARPGSTARGRSASCGT